MMKKSIKVSEKHIKVSEKQHFICRTFAIVDALATNASSAAGLDSVGGVKVR